MGCQFYQRLKHMVHDKIQSRDVGPKTLLERQPAKGKVRGGGLRIGEMERDSLISHGVSKFIQESYTLRSDAYKCFVCKMCGRIAIANPKKQFITVFHVIINIILMKSRFHIALNYLYKNLKHNQFL